MGRSRCWRIEATRRREKSKKEKKGGSTNDRRKVTGPGNWAGPLGNIQTDLGWKAENKIVVVNYTMNSLFSKLFLHRIRSRNHG